MLTPMATLCLLRAMRESLVIGEKWGGFSGSRAWDMGCTFEGGHGPPHGSLEIAGDEERRHVWAGCIVGRSRQLVRNAGSTESRVFQATQRKKNSQTIILTISPSFSPHSEGFPEPRRELNCIHDKYSLGVRLEDLGMHSLPPCNESTSQVPRAWRLIQGPEMNRCLQHSIGRFR